MWIIIPALTLAITHIAGNNLAVVPDMTAVLGEAIYATTIVAYMFFGAIFTGILAWIGVSTGQEINVVVKKLFGCRGKKFLALNLLIICIPASALTGGYFAGWTLSILIGVPYYVTTPVCLAVFSLIAAGYGREFLKFSNYIALLIIPMLAAMFWVHGINFTVDTFDLTKINWCLAIALIGYNAGGMHSVLVVEAASRLYKKGYKAIWLSILAKWIEGVFTLALAHIVIIVGTAGPLALLGVASKTFFSGGEYLFNIILLCIFMNTMVPAMLVNAKQISILTRLSFMPALCTAFIAVWISTFMEFTHILLVMSVTGLVMIVCILYTGYHLHKYNKNKQNNNL